MVLIKRVNAQSNIDLVFSHFSDSFSDVVAVARSVAELPCDVTPSDPNDPVRLVLWYRADSATPIYRLDVGRIMHSHYFSIDYGGTVLCSLLLNKFHVSRC